MLEHGASAQAQLRRQLGYRRGIASAPVENGDVPEHLELLRRQTVYGVCVSRTHPSSSPGMVQRIGHATPSRRAARVGSRKALPRSRRQTTTLASVVPPMDRRAPAEIPAIWRGTRPRAQTCTQARSVRFYAYSSLIPYLSVVFDSCPTGPFSIGGAPSKTQTKPEQICVNPGPFCANPPRPITPRPYMGPMTKKGVLSPRLNPHGLWFSRRDAETQRITLPGHSPHA